MAFFFRSLFMLARSLYGTNVTSPISGGSPGYSRYPGGPLRACSYPSKTRTNGLRKESKSITSDFSRSNVRTLKIVFKLGPWGHGAATKVRFDVHIRVRCTELVNIRVWVGFTQSSVGKVNQKNRRYLEKSIQPKNVFSKPK